MCSFDGLFTERYIDTPSQFIDLYSLHIYMLIAY